MIKYMDLEGYRNLGELRMFSHLYMFREENKETPMIILIHAYECDAKVFKGYLFNKSKTFKTVELTNLEIEKLETYVGKLQQVSFNAFIKETIAEEEYSDFTEQ